MSEWICATPLTAWLPTMHRCAMLSFFSMPSSTNDIRRRRSISPGQRALTSWKSKIDYVQYVQQSLRAKLNLKSKAAAVTRNSGSVADSEPLSRSLIIPTGVTADAKMSTWLKLLQHTEMHVHPLLRLPNNSCMCYTFFFRFVIFTSADWAIHISRSKCCLCMSVC